MQAYNESLASAEFPFNWVPQRVGTTIYASDDRLFAVSIQLGSPASGDAKFIKAVN